MAISVVTPHSVVDLGLLNGMPGINVVAGSHDKRPQNPQLIQGITPDALIQILSLLNIAKPNPGIPDASGGTPEKKEWTYEESELWPDLYPTCGGENQSPINLDTRRSFPFSYKNPIDFKNYDTVDGAWSNDGHALRFDLSPSSNARICGGPLEGCYKLLQFHFHWGNQADQGSEHTVNGQATAAELHLVHMNEKYDTLEEALENHDGLAVVGVLMTNDATSDQSWFSAVSTAAKAREVRTKANKVSGQFNLRQIESELAMRANSDDLSYFTYEGSLTTPPCSEVVTWLVAKTTLPISPNQLASLQNLRFEDGSKMVDNFRPVQDINGRVVSRVCH